MANITTSGTTSYPTALDTRTALTDGTTGDVVVSAHPNGLGAAVIAVESTLGINPQGTKADVATRLNVSINPDGTLVQTNLLATSYVANAVLFGQGTSTILGTNTGISGSLLVQNGGVPTFSATPTIANSLTLGVGSVSTPTLVFQNGSNVNTFTLQPGVTGGNIAFTLPTADGTSGQFLQTNGSGALSFQAAGSVYVAMGDSGASQPAHNFAPVSGMLVTSKVVADYTDAIETNVALIVPATTTATALYVRTNGSNGTAQTVTLRLNGTTTTLAVSVGAAANTTYFSTGSVSLVPGDRINYSLTGAQISQYLSITLKA